ncbi:M48 family metallopeptidase [Coraliomargarita parva]|uniref:M48 family metallopeptidase n=1 Tax=Coraliomargarita parva TaxID=3014050 RepID=UPI003CE4CC35
MTLKYEVVRSARKSIQITVERDRKVVVRAPKQASENSVLAAVESKRYWIWQKLRDPHKYPDPAPRKEYVTGETFLFLGQHYGLTLTHDASGEVKLCGKNFQMAVSDRTSGDTLFRNWYLAEARRRMGPRIASLATEMGVDFSRIWVRDLRYRWGSCTPRGTLSFNWRIIQAPMIVVDYLIVHELAHVLEPNHSQDFWNIVAVHVPSWQKARNWLKLHGAQLEW